MRTAFITVCAVLMLATLADSQRRDSRRPDIEVQIFLQTECPISNRYAPEIQRLQAKFQSPGLNFTLIYPDASDTTPRIAENLRSYHYEIAAERDPTMALAKRASATITPEAAVFLKGRLIYHGRIDDQVAAFGKVRPAATTHELEDAIAAALKGRDPKVTYAPAVGCYISDLR